jgi:choline dehydrogenase
VELIWLAAPYISHGQVLPPKDVEIFTMAAVMLKPQSKGSIKLVENNPFVPPTIDPQYVLSFSPWNVLSINSYLEVESDRNVMVKALRLMLRIARTEPLASKLNLQAGSPNVKPEDNVLWPGDADPDDGACIMA